MNTKLEKELDDIMEDLMVGHNFEYARGAILELLSSEVKALLSRISKEVIGDDKDPNTSGRGFKDGHTTRENKLRAAQRVKLDIIAKEMQGETSDD